METSNTKTTVVQPAPIELPTLDCLTRLFYIKEGIISPSFFARAVYGLVVRGTRHSDNIKALVARIKTLEDAHWHRMDRHAEHLQHLEERLAKLEGKR
jgi:hypothetical protein